jgi:hypothetical protein
MNYLKPISFTLTINVKEFIQNPEKFIKNFNIYLKELKNQYVYIIIRKTLIEVPNLIYQLKNWIFTNIIACKMQEKKVFFIINYYCIYNFIKFLQKILFSSKTFKMENQILSTLLLVFTYCFPKK